MIRYAVSDEESLSRTVVAVAQSLRRSELVAAPTDTVYGIFADAGSEDALDRVYSVKGRSLAKAVALIVADIRVVEALAPGAPPVARMLAESYWPGPLTLLLSTDRPFPPHLLKDGKIAVRCPDSDIARRIAAAMGGFVAVTSANVSGAPPAQSSGQISRALREKINGIVEYDDRGSGSPSSVVEVEDGRLIVHREGSITAAMLAAGFPQQEVISRIGDVFR